MPNYCWRWMGNGKKERYHHFGIEKQLEELRSERKLKGLRHVVQDEPDDDFLNGAAFNRGIALLENTGLVYDILVFERQLPAAIRFVDKHPKQRFVLDHVAKRSDRQVDLSNKEFALLEFLMRNPNRVLSRTQIGEKVWDMNFEPNSNVVDVYISALRRKLDRGFDKELIHTVKGAGYRFGVLS